MDENATAILLQIALAFLTGVFTIIGIYLKKRWGVEATAANLQKAAAVSTEVVRAAEQIAQTMGWDSAAKKKWALSEAARLTGLPETQLEAFIESAVLALKTEYQELTNTPVGIMPKVDAAPQLVVVPSPGEGQ